MANEATISSLSSSVSMALGNQNTIVRHLAKILMGKQFSFIRRLQKAHPKAEIYLVGGSVRDALLGRAIKDFDFVVRGVPIKKIETSLRTLGSMNIVGRTYRTLSGFYRSKRLAARY